MKERFKSITAVLVVSSIVASSSYAGWVDDWVQQKTETSPGYFKGQKRGYVNGGGFSARWQTGSDYVWTVEAPKFKVGCGGIDLTAGSLSYLDFDHLTAKMRKILSNAPAAAFDMALQTLCQPCVQTIKSMSALADQFNNLQINDCQASKALVATITNGKLADSVEQQQGGLAAMNTAVTGGASSWWGGVKESAGTLSNNFGDLSNWVKGNTTPPSDANQQLSNPNTWACPSQLQDFLPDNDGERMSMLDVVGVNKRGLSQDYVDAIRGLVGDIEFRNVSNKIKVSTIAPCADQNGADPNIFLGGSTPKRMQFDANQGPLPCTAMPDSNWNLQLYVSQKIQGIADKMKNKGALTDSDKAFLDTNPLGLSVTLKTAIGTSSENSVIANMSQLTAKAYAYYMMEDLFSIGQATVFALSDAFQKTMVDKAGCDLSTLQPNAQIEITGLLKRISDMDTSAKQIYQASLQESQAVQIYLQRITETQNQFYDRLAKDFGTSVAGRIIKR